jgi:ribosomal protein S18 acetylase RimI-like enzyme
MSGAGGIASEALAGVTLRASEPSDRSFLIALYRSTREREMALVPWPPEQKEAFVRMQFEAQDRYYREQFPSARFDVVEREGSPIGRLYVDRRDKELRVIDITLAPAERGRGMGAALLRGVLEEARASGRMVSIHVEAENRAVRLYRRLGFEWIRDDGVYRLMVCRPGIPDAG